MQNSTLPNLLMALAFLGSSAGVAQYWGSPMEVTDARGTGGDIGKYNSMAIVNGLPAIATFDQGHKRILYMRATDASGSSWSTPVLINAPTSTCSGICLQEVNGKPAIAFLATDLKYVHATDADGTAWGTTVVVDVVGPSAGSFSMKVVNGRPAIAYRGLDGGNYKVRYVRASDADGDSWGTPVVVEGFSPATVVLEVVNGNPAVGYKYIDYVRFVRSTDVNGANWSAGVEAYSSTALADLSMTVVNGMPAFAVYLDTPHGFGYVRATNVNGTSWSSMTWVTGGGAFNSGLRLQLLSVQDSPSVVYFENNNQDLYYIRANNADGTTWAAAQLLDATGYVGTDISAVVVNGSPAVAYRDETNKDLKYMRASTSNGSGIWGPAVAFDGTPIVGSYTTQCIVEGFPALAYYDEVNKDLRYIRALDSTGTVWGTSITIDSLWDAGKAAEMIIVNGRPAIGYVDQQYGVKYVQANDVLGTSWNAPVVVSGSATWVAYISMAIIAGQPAMALGNTAGTGEYRRANDADGTSWGGPHVYFGSGAVELLEIGGLPAAFYFLNGALSFTTGADADGTTWSFPSVTIDATTSNGFHMDAQFVGGHPAVSYFHAGEELRYVRALDPAGQTWSAPITVDATGYSGNRSSLQVVDGNPAIAYFDDFTDDLRYARANDAAGSTWGTPVLLDAFNATGEYPSMRVNGSHVCIAYFNRFQGFAYMLSGASCTVPPPAPTNTTPIDDLSVCAGGSTMLSASGTGGISWYDAASGGVFLGAGDELATGALTTTRIYYAQDSTCAASPRTAIEVTVADAIDTGLSVDANTITSLENGANYQWIDCLNGSAPIPNATAQTYDVPVSGSYAVIITAGACADTSACEAIVVTGLSSTATADEVSVYPVPAGDELWITSPSARIVNVQILDMTGRTVWERSVQSDRVRADVGHLARGSYTVRVGSEARTTTHRVILR